jgi:hypothetical protein
MSVLEVALDPATVIMAVDPGKVTNRVWVSDGSGLLADPVSLRWLVFSLFLFQSR